MKIINFLFAALMGLSRLAFGQSFDQDMAKAIQTVNANRPSVIYQTAGFDLAAFEESMFQFMVCRKLAQADDNSMSAVLKLGQKWKVIRAVDHGPVTALLVNLVPIDSKGEIIELWEDNWEVIAVRNGPGLTLSSDCEHGPFMLFEEAFSLPAVLKAGFENQPAAPRPGLWYAEFTDAASIAYILKSVYTGHPFSGLSVGFTKRPNGKLAWDPTSGRKWSVIHPSYSFRRGSMGIEIGDGFSELFDRNFAEAASGCNYQMSPWSSGAVRQLLLDGKLIEVLRDDLARERNRNTNDGFSVAGSAS